MKQVSFFVRHALCLLLLLGRGATSDAQSCYNICNLVPNGGFENVTTVLGDFYGPITNLSFEQGGASEATIDCWQTTAAFLFDTGANGTDWGIIPFYITPYDSIYPHPNSAAFNHHWVELYSSTSNYITGNYISSLEAPLNSGGLQTNLYYKLDLWVLDVQERSLHGGNISSHYQPGHIQVCATTDSSAWNDFPAFNTNTFPSSIIPLLPSSYAVPMDSAWHHISTIFQYTGQTAGYVLVAPTPWDNDFYGEADFFVDDVSLQYVPLALDTMSTCELRPDLRIYLSNLNIDTTQAYSFSGQGVGYNSGVYSFNPVLGINGVNNIYLAYTNTSGCASTLLVQIYVTNGNAEFSASARPLPACPGETVLLTATGCNSCSWTPVDSVTCSSPACDTATATPWVSTTYRVTDVDSNGCYSIVDVTVQPLKAVIATASAVLCSGDSITLYAYTSPYYSYQWQADTGTGYYTVAGPDTGSSYRAGHAGNYRVIIDNGGCVDTAASMTITVLLRSVPVLTAPASGCAYQSITLSANTGTGYYYQYFYTHHGLTTTETNITQASSLSLSLNDTGAYYFIMTEYNTNGCPAISNIDTVIIKPLPDNFISALTPTSFCLGDSVTLYADTGGSYSYVWLSGGTVISGATRSSYTAGSTGLYRVVITNAGNGCFDTSSGSSITVNTLPTATITPTGPITYCAVGSPTTLNASTGATYQWQKNGINISPGGTSSSYTPTTSGSYTVTITNAAGCSASSAPVVITINPPPAAGITYSGSTSFCAGNSLVLNVTSVSGCSYQWKNGATNVGTGTSYTATTAGTYTYTATNTASGCTATSSGVTITVTPAPTASMSPSGTVNSCQGAPVTLTANSGSGYSYLWHPFTTPGSTYSANSVGTYSVTVTVTAPDGCSATSATTSLIVWEAACICTTFPAFPTVINAGSMTAASFASGGTYLVTGDITLTGTGTIKNAYIMMDGGRINIDAAASITIDSTRVFNCNGAWQGFRLLKGASSSGRLFIRNKSLVEDADTAVVITTPVHPGSGNIFSCDSSIFNANSISVYIQGDSSATSYPYRIRNTVFTSRTGIASAYNNWTTPLTLKAAYTNSNNSYLPPFAINNSSSYTPVSGGGFAVAGIILNRVGKTTAAGTTYSYNELLIGDTTAATDQNLFDNTGSGIVANGANMTVFNAAFINMAQDGINATGQVGAIPFSRNRVQALGTVSQPLLFYGCAGSGVNASNLQSFTGYRNKMVSNQTAGAAENFGYNIKLNQYTLVDIRNNVIINIADGIAVTANNYNTYPASTSAPVSNINVCHNTIRPLYTAGGFSAMSIPQFVNYGITLQNTSPALVPYADYVGAVHIDSNQVDAYNGVLLSGMFRATQKATTDTNVILLRKTSNVQYGIKHQNCRDNSIFNNYIQGLNNTPSSSDTGHVGIYTSMCTSQVIQCNATDSVNIAFMFTGGNTNTKWLHNGMKSAGCYYGLYLYHTGAMIGKQYYKSTDSAIMNTWAPGGWTTGQETFANAGAQAKNSILCVNTGNPLNPLLNDAKPLLTDAYVHGPSATIHVIATTGGVSCTRLTPAGMLEAGPFENVAKNNLSYTSNIGINEWLAQYNVYQSCLADTLIEGTDTGTLLHGSAILRDFKLHADSSRYSYVAKLGQKITTGDISGAFTIWASTPTAYYNMQTDASGVQIMDSSAADAIVSNYRTFYKVYLDYIGDSLSSADSSTLQGLAAGCPTTDGAMVYQARALYTLVFNSLGSFDDYGCSAAHKDLPHADTAQAWDQPGIETVTGGQHYRLHPNPSDGNIYIQQAVPDDDPVAAEVWTNEGKSIYKNKLLFSNGMKHLDLTGITPGLYLLQLRDSKGNGFVLKFIVNK